jgi:uncharacterized Zn finger protein
MNLAQHAASERAGFQIVCDRCGSLSIKMADPTRSPTSALVQCRSCGAVRGTLGDLQDLARRGTDVFEF